MIENVIAHEDETSVWSMCIFPDKVLYIQLFFLLEVLFKLKKF